MGSNVQQLTILPTTEDLEVMQQLMETHGSRFSRALRLRSDVHDLLVTREGTNVQLQATINQLPEAYGVFIDSENVVCGCMDNFVRRTLCKHAIAMCLVAYERKLVTCFELFSLLLG